MYSEDKISIYKDAYGILKIKIEDTGEDYPVKAIWCYPITGAGEYLGLFKIESSGIIREEAAFISDINKLDENSKKLIIEELNKAYLLTQIIKIYSIKPTSTKLGRDKVVRWHVATDKGERTLEVKFFKDITLLRENVVIIRDATGNRFKINSEKLDPKSLALLEIYT